LRARIDLHEGTQDRDQVPRQLGVIPDLQQIQKLSKASLRVVIVIVSRPHYVQDAGSANNNGNCKPSRVGKQCLEALPL
jgi:hypothetical protein